MATAKKRRQGLFDRVPESTASQSYTYPEEGHYIVRIDACRFIENRKGDECIVFEMTCVHNFDEEATEGHRAGDEFSKVYNDKHDATPGNIKSAISTILDIDDDQVTKTLFERCTDDDKQPLAGRFAEINNRPHVTKAGVDMILVNWKRKVTKDELADILTDENYDRFVLGKVKKAKKADDEDEEPPKRKAKKADDDEDDEPPKRKARKDEDDDPPPKRKAKTEDDDDDPPARAKKRSAEDDDEIDSLFD